MTRTRRRCALVAPAAALCLALLWTALGRAYVNPNFTPLHLEEQSKLICTVKVEEIAKDGKSATLTVLDVIKGASPAKKLTLEFTAVLAKEGGKEDVKEIIELLKAAGAKPALLTSGELDGQRCGLLHMEAVWVRLVMGKDATRWQFEKADTTLNGTFNGGTDMFIEAMRFIRKFPSAPIMPVAGGVAWSEHTELGKLAGDAAELQAVDVDGDGKLDLFASCPQGDKVFINKGTGFEELAGLASASRAAAWADFDGDGRVDLASLSDKGLKLYFQKEAGKFTAEEVKLVGKIETGSPTLTVIDIGGDGNADMVVGARTFPVVLRNKDGKGNFETVKLRNPWLEKDMQPPGKAGPCVAADFDGDGLADVVQFYQQRGLFWRGKADGNFEVKDCPGAFMGNVKRRNACMADLDGDGLLDIFLIGGGRKPFLLQNRGGGKFEEVMRLTGEPGYIIQAGAVCAALGDFNNDTFVDVFAGYDGDPFCQFFFNRGFRSLAICGKLKLKEDDVPGAEEEGQAAALWADLNGDGALELVTAMRGGALYLSQSDLADMASPPCLRVKVAREAELAGPVTVRFYLEGRCLGARTAHKWGPPALLGTGEVGEYLVKWRTPDGKEFSRKVELEDNAVEIAIGGKAPSKKIASLAPTTSKPAKPPAKAAARGGPPWAVVIGGAAVAVLLAVLLVVVMRKKR